MSSAIEDKSIEEKQSEFKNASISVTESAVKQLSTVMAADGKEGHFLRMSVEGGGCSGFQYGFKLDDNAEDDDTVLKEDNVSVLIDSLSIQYLFGSTLDYVENLEGSKFIIENPNATTTCGCGASFSI